MKHAPAALHARMLEELAAGLASTGRPFPGRSQPSPTQ